MLFTQGVFCKNVKNISLNCKYVFNPSPNEASKAEGSEQRLAAISHGVSGRASLRLSPLTYFASKEEGRSRTGERPWPHERTEVGQDGRPTRLDKERVL